MPVSLFGYVNRLKLLPVDAKRYRPRNRDLLTILATRVWLPVGRGSPRRPCLISKKNLSFSIWRFKLRSCQERSFFTSRSLIARNSRIWHLESGQSSRVPTLRGANHSNFTRESFSVRCEE